jgi:hypothetical protein
MLHTAIATHDATSTRLVKLTKLLEKHFFVGLLAQLVDVDVPDDPLLVDDEERTFRESTVTEDTVFFGGLTVRPKIRE